jgi:RNA polymerase primary sigma factor
MKGASRIPLLTASEEIELARLVQRSTQPEATPAEIRAGRRAKERMISANLRLVSKIALKKTHKIKSMSGISVEDLLQEGVLGLNRAVELFDPEKGYKFSTYAYWWVTQSIGRALEYSGMIRIPLATQQLHSKVTRALANLGADATFVDACAAVEVDEDRARLAFERINQARTSSYDKTLAGIDGEMNLLELLEDQTATNDMDVVLMQSDLDQLIHKLEALLPDDMEKMRLSMVSSPVDAARAHGITATAERNRRMNVRQRLQAVLGNEALELLTA